MKSTLGIGIIGAGNILVTHALAYRSLPEMAKLIGVADIDQRRADAAKKEHGFQHSYTDYRELHSGALPYAGGRRLPSRGEARPV